MKKLNEMTIEEKIGQLFCVGFQGYEFSDNLKYLIEKYKVSNVIIFTRNIKTTEQLFNLNKEIHKYVLDKTGTIPLVSIDQEGGMVTRIMDTATFCPGSMTIATGKESDAYAVGRLEGEELRALGFNLNLAPSLDVNNNPLNPVIGVRSYSDDPNVVSRYGLNYIRGLQEMGVSATAKHFPGHGDTANDSHKSLPVINHSKERLNSIELVPFKKVLNEVDAIMSAHVFFPAYESGNIPGTLSKNVITNLLRNELGYEGLIISDCMEMKAIDNTFTTPVGCVMGLMAGLDQVMVSATFEKQEKAILAVYDAYKTGKITEDEINKKVERILALKEKSYQVLKEYFYDKEYSDIVKTIDNPEHKEAAQRIVDKSLTLAKGQNIDYKYIFNNETLIIATEPFATTIAEDELSERSIGSAIIENKLQVQLRRIRVEITDEEINELVTESKKYKQVIFFTYNANIFTNQVKLVNLIDAIHQNLIVFSTRNPYDLHRFKQIKNYLCMYEYTPNSVRTIIKWLKQELYPTAKLPISLEDRIEVGASIYMGLDDYSVEDNIKYLELLKEKHITNVFCSGHMPERNANFNYELNLLVTKAKELGIKMTLDINKPIYDEGNVPEDIYALRLDWGFTEEDILNLYHEGKYVIELNASTVNKRLLDFLKFNGVNFSNVRCSHNFYPKVHTGLDYQEIIKRNELYHEYGLKVIMFIPSHNMHRPPMYEGLPTLEEHRDMNLYSILSTIKYLKADSVFFGDSYASSDEIDIASHFYYDNLSIPILVSSNLSVFEKEALKGIHYVRIDSPVCFTRSGRVVREILPHDNLERHKYDVTIDNVKFGRYQGEVNIMRTDLPSDDRVNVIGKALINDLVLKALENGKAFKFVILGEYD